MSRTAADIPDHDVEFIRKIVERHHVPSFVTGFDVQLGEFDNEPALWVIFYTTGNRPDNGQEREMRAKALFALREEVHADLRQHIADRYPYFRFSNVQPAESPAE